MKSDQAKGLGEAYPYRTAKIFSSVSHGIEAHLLSSSMRWMNARITTYSWKVSREFISTHKT